MVYVGLTLSLLLKSIASGSSCRCDDCFVTNHFTRLYIFVTGKQGNVKSEA